MDDADQDNNEGQIDETDGQNTAENDGKTQSDNDEDHGGYGTQYRSETECSTCDEQEAKEEINMAVREDEMSITDEESEEYVQVSNYALRTLEDSDNESETEYCQAIQAAEKINHTVL